MITKTKFKAGVVQFDVKDGDVRGNLSVALGHLGFLADQGAYLGVCPEFFLTGFDNENMNRLMPDVKEGIQRLAEFARKRSMAVAGSMPEQKDGQIFNTLYLIDQDGEIRIRYRKMHLFPLTGEDLHYARGDEMVTADTSLGRIGTMICYDLRFPELARRLFLDGARLFVISAQWPLTRVAHWQALIRARAIENQAWFVCCNRTGTDINGLVFPGSSMIVDPNGSVLVQGDDKPGIVIADIDMDLVDLVRQTIPVGQDRRGDIYG
ncbi:carbon-nitrogen family hydrolase [uncultured Desulfobacter sp.]|uniref:carbon-nitrogen family hydrolase n=1 Tax=uncultured Desulfobacter sp. TaxID=240139 RepID=UPI0029C70AB8|nr:carbon-nitrogen family hydrolase [uncultured Desulfobacter sp.]